MFAAILITMVIAILVCLNVAFSYELRRLVDENRRLRKKHEVEGYSSPMERLKQNYREEDDIMDLFHYISLRATQYDCGRRKEWKNFNGNVTIRLIRDHVFVNVEGDERFNAFLQAINREIGGDGDGDSYSLNTVFSAAMIYHTSTDERVRVSSTKKIGASTYVIDFVRVKDLEDENNEIDN